MFSRNKTDVTHIKYFFKCGPYQKIGGRHFGCLPSIRSITTSPSSVGRRKNLDIVELVGRKDPKMSVFQLDLIRDTTNILIVYSNVVVLYQPKNDDVLHGYIFITTKPYITSITHHSSLETKRPLSFTL